MLLDRVPGGFAVVGAGDAVVGPVYRLVNVPEPGGVNGRGGGGKNGNWRDGEKSEKEGEP